MAGYSHLLDQERDQIASLKAAGRSIGAIAKAVGRAKSTVSRELRRDLIICKRTRPVLVLHERKSRVTLATRLAGKTAAETISVLLAVFGRIHPALRKSVTFDNDTAFAQHALLRSMRNMTTWFCDAYASWQKGGVENANGRLRRWLPRHTDIDQMSDEELQDIVMTANLTPRKCLGFLTPFQAIIKELGKDVQIRFA